MSQLIQSDDGMEDKQLFRERINRLFSDYSFQINRVETTYFERCRSELQSTSTPNQSASNREREPIKNQLKYSYNPFVDESSDGDNNDEQNTSNINTTVNKMALTVEGTKKCEICGEVFNRYCHFKRHMKDIHGVKKPFVCEQCPEGSERSRFARRGCLKRHIERDHLTIRNHQCPHCPKTFFTKYEWGSHQPVHDGKKPFQCDHCSQKFARRENLRIHIKVVHLKEKNYPCSFCGKRFRSLGSMKGHSVTQHDDARYARFQCKVCSKRFYRGDQCRQHEERHRRKN